MLKHVVVWDPTGSCPEGSLVSGVDPVRQLKERGVVLLPVETQLMDRNPVGGFFVKHWGPGWPYDNDMVTRGCPMLLYVTPEVRELHWAARVVPIGFEHGHETQPDPIPKHHGLIRLTAHGGIMGAISGGLSAVAEPLDVSRLDNPDKLGGWSVQGSSKLSPTTEGYLALSLQGACTGIALVVTAVSAA